MAKSKAGALGNNEAGHIVASGGANNANGTATIGPAVVDIKEVDGISFEVSWTGTAAGAIKIEVSNSYLPNPRDINGVAPNLPIRTGQWTDVTSRALPAVSQPAGSPGKSFLAFSPSEPVMQAKYIRISYTNTAGAGALDVWMNGKAVG